MEIWISELRLLMGERDENGKFRTDEGGELHQASITAVRRFLNFADFRRHMLERLCFPREQTGKYNCYGYSAALYKKIERTSRAGNQYMAHWRCAESEFDRIHTFIGDFDNAKPHLPIVPIEDVCERLDMMGLSYFYHTTFSHTPEKPKARFCIDMNRVITRDEMLRIYVYLNYEVFGGQADASIYAPGDFLYGPPFKFDKGWRDAKPIDVDDMLELERELTAEHPEVWVAAEGSQRTATPKVALTPEQNAAYEEKRGDMSVRTKWVSIKNPEVFNPEWKDDYKKLDRPGVLGSHWRGMRSILASVWLKNKGKLTYGEMLALFDEIDATENGYFRNKYTTARDTRRIDEVIEFVMKQQVPDDDPDPEDDPPSAPQPDDHGDGEGDAAAAETEIQASDPSLAWGYFDDPCGSGKSFILRELIVKSEQRQWLFAVDKVERIHEVMAEFTGHHWKMGGFDFHDAFSGKVDESGNSDTVIGQLAGIRHLINSRCNNHENYRSITFITHAALLMFDWTGWDDHSLVCDEKPGIWHYDVMESLHHNFDIVKRNFEIDAEEGDRIRLKLTAMGAKIGAHATKIDAFDKRIWPLLNLAYRNRHVWINREAWDANGDAPVEFYALTLPDAYSPFRERWMAADNLSRSHLYRMWERCGVTWTKAVLPGGRVRVTPLASRGVVCYFMNHGASFTRFRQPDQPHIKAAKYIVENHPSDVLVSINSKFRKGMQAVFDDESHTLVSPRQTGTERWKDRDVLFWAAAMQASQCESDLIKKLTGMTRQELDEDREFDAMNQFAFRGNARDYNSDTPFVLYVMSRAQANYFAARYDMAVEYVEGVVVEVENKKPGRKTTTGIAAMSDDEMRAYKAEKKRQERAKKKATTKSGGKQPKNEIVANRNYVETIPPYKAEPMIVSTCQNEAEKVETKGESSSPISSTGAPITTPSPTPLPASGQQLGDHWNGDFFRERWAKTHEQLNRIRERTN